MLLGAITHLCPKFWGGVAKMISSFEISTWINDYIPKKILSSLIHVLIQYDWVNTKVYPGNLIITKEFPFSNWHDVVSGACSEIKWDSQLRSVAFQFRIFLSREAEINHDDVIKWKHFPRYWPFVRRIHRSSVNRDAGGDLRRHRHHYDVIVMMPFNLYTRSRSINRILKSENCCSWWKLRYRTDWPV